MLKWLKNAWPWSSKSPNDAIWPKNFKAKDVLKAIEKLPNVKEEKRPVKRKPALKKATTRSKTMPLKKSATKKAFVSNLKEELKAGKPKAQALAIAYSEKNAAAKKTKKK